MYHRPIFGGSHKTYQFCAPAMFAIKPTTACELPCARCGALSEGKVARRINMVHNHDDCNDGLDGDDFMSRRETLFRWDGAADMVIVVFHCASTDKPAQAGRAEEERAAVVQHGTRLPLGNRTLRLTHGVRGASRTRQPPATPLKLHTNG